MHPLLVNFDYCIETGNFAKRCKEIKIEPVQTVSSNLKDKDIISEIDELNLEKSNFKKNIEKIKKEAEYNTKKDIEQHIQNIENVFKRKFSDLKSLLKLDFDLEMVVDAYRNNTRTEALDILKERVHA